MENSNPDPLVFFEDFYNLQLTSFLKDAWANSVPNLNQPTVDVNTGIITYIYLDENGVPSIEKHSVVETDLVPFLKEKYKIAKNQLWKNSLKLEEQEFRRSLKGIGITAQFIINSNTTVIKNIPELLTPITSLINYINRKYLSEEPIKLDIPNFQDFPITTGNSNIDKTIAFLQGKKSKDRHFMNKEDFEYLVEVMKYWLANKAEPKDLRVLPKVQIPNHELAFCFWTLGQAINSKNERVAYRNMIFKLFENFKKQSPETFRKNFGSSSDITRPLAKYLPDYVKLQINQNQKKSK